jgi:antitoxin component YwqK of YwqJK toxin-antitoxin module
MEMQMSMTRISSALTLALLLSSAAAAQEKSAREKANLIGPVRSVRTQSTSYTDETLKQSTGTKQKDAVTYDQNGNEIERIIYDDYGYYVGKEVRTYDSKGNLIESIVSEPKGELERRTFTYENGKLRSIVTHDPKSKTELRQVNSYGKDGLLLEEKYFASQTALGKTVYKYEQNGNVAEVAFYNPNGAKTSGSIGPCLGAHRLTYFYDEQRKAVKVVAYEPNGDLKQSWQYSYNSKGETTESTRESAWSKEKYVYTYEYDSRGNWIRQVVIMSALSKTFDDTAFKSASVISREVSYYQ